MKIVVHDIETLLEMFLIGLYVPEHQEYYEFEVSREKNTLDALIKFIDRYEQHYWVGYNSLSFDSQVIEWIIRNHHKWNELGWEEICFLIAQKANDTIHDSNYGVFSEYREEWLTLKQIDVFRINHFDNKNRMVSLKRVEFEMDFPNIEEMSIHHMKKNLSPEELQGIRHYCKNDVMATYEFYKITIGETEHPEYKEKNQIQLRKDIEEEFGIPCLNYSDSKIGDEMIKKFYCQEKGIKYNELPKKGLFRKEVLLKNCIAPYIEFKTPELKDFLKKLKKMSLRMSDDFKESIVFYRNTYSFMQGGLHSENKPQIYEANEDMLIIDYDVSSMYPATIINNGKYPGHLGKEFLRGYKQMFDKRLELKPQAKKDKRIKGIVGALKLAVNSVYGKSSDMQNWIYDRQLTLFTTITGELSLMALIESYELEGIHVISANTDGVTIYINKELVPKVEKVNKWWMESTGYVLERADYKKIVYSSVNDYLAIKTDGEIKKIGDFLTDFELHKNKSARIVPLALEKFYVEGIPIEKTITEHKNIYDFAIRQKASKDFHYEGISREGTSVYNKLIRYYVSNTGEKLLKIKNPECQTNAAKVSQVEAGEWLCHVCNFLPKDHPTTNVNFNYYIERANRIISKIQLEGKKNKVVVIPNQISLF